MLSLGVRSSLLAGRYVLNVEKLLSTSAVLCNGGAKIYKSTRERELLSEYKAHGKNKVIRFEKTTPEDIPLLVDFMSEICERQEPTSVSIGVTADEFKPFTAKIAEEGINYSLVFIDEDRVIGAGIGNVVTLDPKTAIEPRILGNYGEIIDAMADWLPSRKMRRVVAPAYELCNMVSHFLPKDVKKVMRYELCCVDKRAVGSNLINKCIYEVTMMGLRDGIKYGDSQATAAASHHVHTKNGGKAFFHIPFEKMFDNGERIHKVVPLHDKSPGVTGFILDLETVAKKSKC